MGTLAFVTLDCASKRRVRYRLSAPIREAHLESFSDLQVERRDFSRFVVGGQVQVTIRDGQSMSCSGILDQSELTVTFGKLGLSVDEAAVEACMQAFNVRLQNAGFEPVTTRRSAQNS